MSPDSILLPLLAMVVLTFAVMVCMGYRRVTTLRRERIHPQKVATSAQMAATIADSRASDNFRNLFELPVLFYVAVLVALATAQTGWLVLLLAWLFVGLRIVHSLIHCSYNRVMHRFVVFLCGAAVLLVLWIVLALGLIR